MAVLKYAYLMTGIIGPTLLSSLLCTVREVVVVVLRLLSFGYHNHCSPIVSDLYGIPVSISWFNSQLPLEKHIHSIQMKPFDSSRGRSSDLICEGTIKHYMDSIPKKVIIKCSQAGLLNRFKTNLRSAFREGFVYESNLFAHAVSPLNTPKLIFSKYSSIYSEAVLVIEDLRSNKYGFNAVDVFGSLKHPPKYSKSERKYILDLIVQQLAALHSRNWNSTDLLKFTFLSGVGFYKNVTDTSDYSMNECRYNFSIFYTRMKWTIAQRRLEQNRIEWLNKDSSGLNCENSMEFPLKISTKVTDYINKALKVSMYQQYIESIRKRPFSLCHADCHGDNIFISPSAGCKSLFEIKPSELYYFDLQEVGIDDPVSDIAKLFVVNCICQHGDSITDTKDLLQETLRSYVDEVARLGVSKEYTYERCLKSFYISVLEKFTWIFIMFCGEEKVYKLPLLQYIHNILSFVIDSCDVNHDPTPLRPMIFT